MNDSNQTQNPKKKLMGFLFSTFVGLIILFFGLSMVQVNAFASLYVTVSAPTFRNISTGTTISCTANQTAYLYLYVDGSMVKSGYGTYLSHTFTTANRIKKHTIMGSGWIEVNGYLEFDNDTKYTRLRFNLSDPDPVTDNKGSDIIRHPDSTTVWNAQYEILSDMSVTAYDPEDWINAIWDRLEDDDIAPWTGGSGWPADTTLASDYIGDGALNGYDCSAYSGFITGMARSVGLPARMWSIASLSPTGYGWMEHMIPEVFTPDLGWAIVDVGCPDNMRGNWESSLSDTQGSALRAKTDYDDVDGDSDENEKYVDHLTLIWDINSTSAKAWKSIDTGLPGGYYTPFSYYEVQVTAGRGTNVSSSTIHYTAHAMNSSYEKVWNKEIRTRDSSSSVDKYSTESSKINWSAFSGILKAEEYTYTYLRWVGYSALFWANGNGQFKIKLDRKVTAGHSSPQKMYAAVQSRNTDGTWARIGSSQSLTTSSTWSGVGTFTFSDLDPGKPYRIFLFYSDGWIADWNTTIYAKHISF